MSEKWDTWNGYETEQNSLDNAWGYEHASPEQVGVTLSSEFDIRYRTITLQTGGYQYAAPWVSDWRPLGDDDWPTLTPKSITIPKDAYYRCVGQGGLYRIHGFGLNDDVQVYLDLADNSNNVLASVKYGTQWNYNRISHNMNSWSGPFEYFTLNNTGEDIEVFKVRWRISGNTVTNKSVYWRFNPLSYFRFYFWILPNVTINE